MERQPRRHRPPNVERGYVPPEESATVKQLRDALTRCHALIEQQQLDLDAERAAHDKTRDDYQQLIEAQRALIEGERGQLQTLRLLFRGLLFSMRDTLLFLRTYTPHTMPDRPQLTVETVEAVLSGYTPAGGEEAK